ncbi:hypothetical protein D3C84_331320 [compost metagenome]
MKSTASLTRMAVHPAAALTLPLCAFSPPLQSDPLRTVHVQPLKRLSAYKRKRLRGIRLQAPAR